MDNRNDNRDLPQAFLTRLRHLEDTYLMSDDPIRQSGFSGGAERWRREREPLLKALREPGGDVLDVCCANGYLLECLVEWGRDRSLDIVPFGIDQGSKLIEVARRRLPQFAGDFRVANAWDWKPPRQYQYVYALWDCVPEEYLAEFVLRLIDRYVEKGGRLILGAYGSLSRDQPPFDLETFLRSAGYQLSGSSSGRIPEVAHFVWLDRNKCD
jgi:SAM-dependent methyltransferase